MGMQDKNGLYLPSNNSDFKFNVNLFGQDAANFNTFDDGVNMMNLINGSINNKAYPSANTISGNGQNTYSSFDKNGNLQNQSSFSATALQQNGQQQHQQLQQHQQQQQQQQQTVQPSWLRPVQSTAQTGYQFPAQQSQQFNVQKPASTQNQAIPAPPCES